MVEWIPVVGLGDFIPLGRKVALWMPDKVQVVFGVTLRPNSGNPTGHGCVFGLGFLMDHRHFWGALWNEHLNQDT